MTQVPTSKLKHYHLNPRRGDVDAVAASLSTLGQFKPIVVNKGGKTGRRNEVLAGNHTLKAARKLGWTHIEADYVDVDDDTAAKIVVADNKTADNATYDTTELLGLLQSLPDADGTGYSGDDIQDLLIESELQAIEPAAPGPAATEPESAGDKWAAASRRSIVVDFPVPVFHWMQEQLYELSKTKGAKSNAATVRLLLQEENAK